MKKNQIPNILHLFWGQDQPLSYLRWLTAHSFSKLNPGWEIKVWRPREKGILPTWSTREHSAQAWDGPDWIDRIEEAGENIRVHEAPISDFPPLSDVHRKDLLCWRTLYRDGGWWSDFDIVYCRPMNALRGQLDHKADCLLCWGEIKVLENWQAIGLLASVPRAALFRKMEELGLKLAKARHLQYQDLGENLLKRFAMPRETESCGSRISNIPQRAVYPFSDVRNQMWALWRKGFPLETRCHTIGVHWFGAQKISCRKEQLITGPETLPTEGGLRWALKMGGLMPEKQKEDCSVSVSGQVSAETIRYSFLMPYINRVEQFYNTLVSFHQFYGTRTDWEVVLAEDVKCIGKDRVALLEVITGWQAKGLKINHLQKVGSPDQFNPSPLFNTAAAAAAGDILILTSPEVFHRSDILSALDDEFDLPSDIYVVCACQDRKECRSRINTIEELKGRRTKWFQHSELRPANYHFCTVLSKGSWKTIGGFDDAYSDGYCFDDDDFREKVRAAGLEFIVRDDLLTFHQQHSNGHKPPDHMDRWNRNRELYISKWGPYVHLKSPLVDARK